MEDILLSAGKVRTVPVDHSLVQLNALQPACPHVRIAFRHFLVLMDRCRRYSGLSMIIKIVSERTSLWMQNFGLASTKDEWDRS